MIPMTTLDVLMKVRGLNQSALAKAAGVSRQAVSLWFMKSAEDRIGIRGAHLLELSRALNLSLDELVAPLPRLDPEGQESLTAELLWDKLYPDLVAFSIALARGELQALARLAQVFGLFRAAKMAGDAAWSRFPEYARLIHPQRRGDLERVWRLAWARV